MAEVVIYLTSFCPFCLRAKALFAEKGVEFTEINLTEKPKQLAELKKKTGMRTVPQIFINGELIGGFEELAALDETGELDKKLK